MASGAVKAVLKDHRVVVGDNLVVLAEVNACAVVGHEQRAGRVVERAHIRELNRVGAVLVKVYALYADGAVIICIGYVAVV